MYVTEIIPNNTHCDVKINQSLVKAKIVQLSSKEAISLYILNNSFRKSIAFQDRSDINAS